jgi:hypothetical protein
MQYQGTSIFILTWFAGCGLVVWFLAVHGSMFSLRVVPLTLLLCVFAAHVPPGLALSVLPGVVLARACGFFSHSLPVNAGRLDLSRDGFGAGEIWPVSVPFALQSNKKGFL